MYSEKVILAGIKGYDLRMQKIVHEN